VISRVRKVLQVELPLRTLFEAPTIAGSAQRVHDALAGGTLAMGPILPVPRALDLQLSFGLSFAQERLWFLDQLEPSSAVYNVPVALRLEGALDAAVLKESLSELVRRHETLRTRFENGHGRPAQVIEPFDSLEFPVIDLSDLAEARRQCVEEAQRPFDLLQPRMLRARLFRSRPTTHILMLTMHHIASDGWSLGVLLRELGILYQAFSADQSSPLPELPVQYADFAVWQRNWLSGEVLEKQLSYWKQQLEGAPARLELPTDRPRPVTPSYRGATEEMVLPQPLLAALKALSRQEGATLFMTLLTAFQILLGRYSGQQDFTVGIPIAGRNRAEIEGLIGFFVNMLVLRCDTTGDPTFRDLLRRVREVLLEAYAHQDLPFEKLVEELRPERNMRYGPLCQVIFAMQNTPAVPAKLGDLDLSVESVPSGTAKFDLSLHMSEAANGLRARVEYSTDLFDRETILRLLANFRSLLEGIAASPGDKIWNLPLLSSGERKQILVDWNATEVSYPLEQDECLHHLFEQQAERTPDAAAVVFGEQRLTYRELNLRANHLANHLRKLGVAPDDLVGVCVERSIEMVVGLLGILKSGAAYVPLDPAYPKERLDFILEDAQVRVLLTQERIREWAEIATSDPENPASTPGPDHPGYVIYTSGSTGRPKGVVITHRSAVALVRWAQSAFDPDELAGVLFSTSICFDLSVFELFVPLSCGGKAILVGNALQLHESPAAAEVTLINTVPSVMKELLLLGALPPSVHTVNLAGELLSVDLVQEIYRIRGRIPGVRKVYDLYGPSETTTYSTFALRRADGPCTIGRPIANTRIYILDAHLQPVPIGVAGELCIGGDGLARGYLNRPELTAEKFIADPFAPKGRIYRTGDLARYRPDGNIEFLGRMDQQVKIRGFRIELEEIEAALKQHPDVSQCVVTAPEDAAGDKRLVAYVVPAHERASATAIGELRDFLKHKLPGYMLPAAFVMLPSLPVTPNGKIDRKALPEPDRSSEGLGLEREFVAPRTVMELQLAQIWERILAVPSVSVNDNFFALGGHSLLGVRVISEVLKSLQRRLPLPVFFENPTIEGMARELQSKHAHGEPELIRLAPGDLPGALFLLEAGIGLCRLAHLLKGGPASFASVVPLQGEIHGKKSELPSLEELAAAHAALVRGQQPSSPCVLAGHSIAGLLAFEAAHQLQREGRAVEMILLLDSWAIPPPSGVKLKAMTPDLTAVHRNAWKNYKCHPLDSRGVLFRARDNPWPLDALDGCMGWSGLFTRGLEIVEVPGDHFSLLEAPHLLTLAQRFQECLR
jgi:amino acid adenylation domain-containing protein